MLVSWRLFLKMRYLSYVDDSINSTFDLWDSILCTSLLNRSFINSCCFTSSVPFLPFPHLPFQLPYFLSSSGLQESSCLYWWWKHLHAKYLRALIAMSSLSNVHFPSAGQFSAQVFIYFFPYLVLWRTRLNCFEWEGGMILQSQWIVSHILRGC